MTSEGLEHALCRMKHVHAIDNPAFEFYTRQCRFGTAWGQVNGHMITLINVKCHGISPSEGSVGRLLVTYWCIAAVVLCMSHPQSSQVTASLVITGVITYNVTRFSYDTNKEILLYSKAYYAQKQRKHFGPEQVCSFLECPAKAYPSHSNEKTLLYTYRCESG